MATARVFFRYSGKGNGWGGEQGSGSSTMMDSNGAENHAERQAWREAQKKLQSWFDSTHQNFDGSPEVKIWVDQTICPQCKLWMIAGVLRNLAAFEFKPKLFVEVRSSGHTRINEVTRDAIWEAGMSDHNGTLAQLSAATTIRD